CTSWTEPVDAFEQALHTFVRSVYADEALMDDIGGWVEQHLIDAGRCNSLAQKLLQLTMPGVPDVYQGQELPALALVDPDNRRPVDYDLRLQGLGRMATRPADVDPKLLVTAAALRLRRDRPASFGGDYTPLLATG